MNYLFIHAGFIIAGFLSMSAGISVAIFLKQKRWWLKFHRKAGMGSSVFFLAGLTGAIVMVAHQSGNHFQGIHAFVGVTVIFLIVTTPIIGFMQFKYRAKTAALRVTHRWFGRLTLLMAFSNIILGVLAA